MIKYESVIIVEDRYRKNIRYKGFDYTSNEGYFVTIVTDNRINYFGKVLKDKVILNKYGKILEETLLSLPIAHKNIELYEYVIMPNHVHAVVLLQNTKENKQRLPYIIRQI